jgi:2-polyprenyl-3-methyl-5-hydroxy-6-metoxy-1,4-benzoquinol methylase
MSYATGTSNLAQWDWILWAIESSPWPHEHIMDVGAGYGKAAVLLREKLNVKPKWIDGIEPDWDAFAHVLVDHGYGEVRACTAQEFDGWDAYDTVLMADVIEHMPLADGLALIDRIPGQIIISTPLVADVAEHAADPDIPDLERHVAQWDIHDFRRTGRLDTYWLREQQYIDRLKPRAA